LLSGSTAAKYQEQFEGGGDDKKQENLTHDKGGNLVGSALNAHATQCAQQNMRKTPCKSTEITPPRDGMLSKWCWCWMGGNHRFNMVSSSMSIKF